MLDSSTSQYPKSTNFQTRLRDKKLQRRRGSRDGPRNMAAIGSPDIGDSVSLSAKQISFLSALSQHKLRITSSGCKERQTNSSADINKSPTSILQGRPLSQSKRPLTGIPPIRQDLPIKQRGNPMLDPQRSTRTSSARQNAPRKSMISISGRFLTSKTCFVWRSPEEHDKDLRSL